MSRRERISSVLDRLGVFDLVMFARGRSRLPILSAIAYHSVGAPSPGYLFDEDVMDATPDEFRRHLALIARDFTAIDIEDLCAMIDDGQARGERARSRRRRATPANPILITFDDGYRSCVDVALPLLVEFGLPATFFIATHYVTERRLYWWDAIHYLVKSSPRQRIALEYPRALVFDWASAGSGSVASRKHVITTLLKLVKAEPAMDIDRFLNELAHAAEVEWTRDLEAHIADQLIMTWEDIRTLRDAGMDIQSHTRTHRVLQTLTHEALLDELAGSRADLEREVGAPARTVAYPVGHSIADQPEIRAAVEAAGYEVGFTNASGVNYLWGRRDRFDIRRLAMERGMSPAMFRGGLTLPVLPHMRRH